jgi:hypothetical protein
VFGHLSVRGVQNHHLKNTTKNLTLVLFWPLTHPPTTGITDVFGGPLNNRETSKNAMEKSIKKKTNTEFWRFVLKGFRQEHLQTFILGVVLSSLCHGTSRSALNEIEEKNQTLILGRFLLDIEKTICLTWT